MKKIIFKMLTLSTLLSAVTLEAKNLEVKFENFCVEWKEKWEREFGTIREGTKYNTFILEYTNDNDEKVSLEIEKELGFYDKAPSPISRGKEIPISLKGVDSGTTLKSLKVTAEGNKITEQPILHLGGFKRWKKLRTKKITYKKTYKNVKNGATIVIGAPYR